MNGFVVLYLGAIVAANLIVATYAPLYGPWVSIAVGFAFIGLDLTCRDRLHDAWRGLWLLPKMAVLIATGSVLSYLINRDAGRIALASFVAFAGASSVDALVYQALWRWRWLWRVNVSNLPSAAADSLIFPTLAFGGFLPWVVAGQFLAKTVGGAAWSFILQGARHSRSSHA